MDIIIFFRGEGKKRTGEFSQNMKYNHHLAPNTTKYVKLNLLVYVELYLHVSIRALAEEAGISKCTVQRILSVHKYRPFKIHSVQALRLTYFERRLEFVAFIRVI